MAHVGLTIDNDWLKVAIEDEGSGFSAEDADMLLEPFVRAEPSRARATGGALIRWAGTTMGRRRGRA